VDRAAPHLLDRRVQSVSPEALSGSNSDIAIRAHYDSVEIDSQLAAAPDAGPRAAGGPDERRRVALERRPCQCGLPELAPRPQVRAGVVERGAEREGEDVAGLLGPDDRVDEAAGGGVAGVELVLVVGADGLDLRPERLVGLLPRLLQLLELRAEERHDRALAFHHAHPPRGPSEDEIRIEALSGHGVVAGAGG